MLEVGDSDRLYWESCGNPHGKPVIMLHGGPGSGCAKWHRRLFNPATYRVLLFDQRGCGRSTRHASALDVVLKDNHTWNLVADIERLRQHLQVERWFVVGGSWGSTLALAYAEKYVERVSGIILWGVTTGRRKEFDWLFRGGLAILLPQEWERLRAGVPEMEREDDIVEAYHRLLNVPDFVVRERAALEWCTWESATPAWPPTHSLSPRFADPAYRMAFSRIVTHYVRHNAWLEDDSLLRGAVRLKDIPGIMVNGRFDFQAPIAWAWDLQRAWRGSQLVIVDNAGHDPLNPALAEEIVRATDLFTDI
jgi:proline iminopeptidase